MRTIVFILVFFLGYNSRSQNLELKEALNILDNIQKAYEAKTGELKFKIENTYRHTCSDSIVAKEELNYWVRNGEYYIFSSKNEIVMTKEFFISINHNQMEVIFSDYPSLDYMDKTNPDYSKRIRELFLSGSTLSLDSNNSKEGKLYVITAYFKQREGVRFDKMIMTYTPDFTFKSITYYETPGLYSPIAQFPNCISIKYFDEEFTRIKKNPFKLSNYISKSNGIWVLSKAYNKYKLIEQIKPYE